MTAETVRSDAPCLCASLPVAAVPPVLDCGYCLVGGMKASRFLCKNVGFSVGKFCVMPKKSWPPPSFKVSDPSLLPGERTTPPKEMVPWWGLARVHLGLEMHRKQTVVTRLSSCRIQVRVSWEESGAVAWVMPLIRA